MEPRPPLLRAANPWRMLQGFSLMHALHLLPGAPADVICCSPDGHGLWNDGQSPKPTGHGIQWHSACLTKTCDVVTVSACYDSPCCLRKVRTSRAHVLTYALTSPCKQVRDASSMAARSASPKLSADRLAEAMTQADLIRTEAVTSEARRHTHVTTLALKNLHMSAHSRHAMPKRTPCAGGWNRVAMWLTLPAILS